ncbi:MAG: hypothetical protein OEM94_02605 [Acidimicrobiia bacterium]|nr:hypothetical protein [Acidimicrobiia bacterium]
MDDRSRLMAAQLARMRGMNRYYHGRFFSDVRFSAIALLALFVVGWWEVPEAFLLIPFVALYGATMTAFDASYLLFARHYAARLEADLNAEFGDDTLLAATVEQTYLFPLDVRKIVVAQLGSGFTWFGFMTLFITAIGLAAFGFGLALGWPVVTDHGGGWAIAYGTVLAIAGLGAVGVGTWWFVGGEGERRLRAGFGRDR